MQDARQEVHLDGVHLCCKKGVCFKDKGSFGVHILFWVCICQVGNSCSFVLTLVGPNACLQACGCTSVGTVKQQKVAAHQTGEFSLCFTGLFLTHPKTSH